MQNDICYNDSVMIGTGKDTDDRQRSGMEETV